MLYSPFMLACYSKDCVVNEQFMEPPTSGVCSIRAYWTPHYCNLDARMNIHRADMLNVAMGQRLVPTLSPEPLITRTGNPYTEEPETTDNHPKTRCDTYHRHTPDNDIVNLNPKYSTLIQVGNARRRAAPLTALPDVFKSQDSRQQG